MDSDVIPHEPGHGDDHNNDEGANNLAQLRSPQLAAEVSRLANRPRLTMSNGPGREPTWSTYPSQPI